MAADAYRLRVCQETAEFDYIPGTVQNWSPRAQALGGVYNGTFVARQV
eukprot:COSAG05_NODE_5046_length_1280_cov_6.022862_3_plen_48_part_00